MRILPKVLKSNKIHCRKPLKNRKKKRVCRKRKPRRKVKKRNPHKLQYSKIVKLLMRIIGALRNILIEPDQSASIKEIVKELYVDEVPEGDTRVWTDVQDALNLGVVWGMVRKHRTYTEVRYSLTNKFSDFLSELEGH
uniref:Uncharacterized protein n=1 Tax=Clastoptera arizonana TaxID=38151 RepID=A0A1B6EBT0_9HEMI